MTEQAETHAAESRASKECGENCDVEEKEAGGQIKRAE